MSEWEITNEDYEKMSIRELEGAEKGISYVLQTLELSKRFWEKKQTFVSNLIKEKLSKM